MASGAWEVLDRAAGASEAQRASLCARLRHAATSKPLQEWILRHNPCILGGDMVSFDHPADTDMPFLRTYFKAGGMILCPLVGLGEIEKDEVTMCAAPMRLVGTNGAPCRVFAW